MAARSTGARDTRILLKHVLPNAMPPIFVIIAVDLAVAIMLEATLSFLGVGVPLTEPSLGMMIAIGKNYVYAGMWWMVLFPGAALILLVIGINLFGDWLREELTRGSKEITDEFDRLFFERRHSLRRRIRSPSPVV